MNWIGIFSQFLIVGAQTLDMAPSPKSKQPVAQLVDEAYDLAKEFARLRGLPEQPTAFPPPNLRCNLFFVVSAIVRIVGCPLRLNLRIVQ